MYSAIVCKNVFYELQFFIPDPVIEKSLVVMQARIAALDYCIIGVDTDSSEVISLHWRISCVYFLLFVFS